LAGPRAQTGLRLKVLRRSHRAAEPDRYGGGYARRHNGAAHQAAPSCACYRGFAALRRITNAWQPNTRWRRQRLSALFESRLFRFAGRLVQSDVSAHPALRLSFSVGRFFGIKRNSESYSPENKGAI